MAENKRKILVVDDEPAIRDSLRLLLTSTFEVSTAPDGAEALKLLEQVQPDLILLDVMMPNLDGIETLRKIRELQRDTPVVMLSALNTVKTAVQAMKHGAVDYLNKPFEIEELTALILKLLEQGVETAPLISARSARADQEIEADFGSLVGKTESMREVFNRVSMIAERDTTILITGESGTGKELIAREIHRRSKRATGPFIAINCAAIPETLIESELFGHEKGAFTNAIESRIGHFELANGGTLFLDEIGELSLAVQVKLLRFLQEQEFFRVGRSKPTKVDVRIVAATNRTLEDLIKEKRFRQDLYYRINVIGVNLPPLRDRFEDIPVLVEHFVDKFAPSYDGRRLVFSKEALDVLVEYNWPGNVRELENVIESLMALTAGQEITPEFLPRKLANSSAPLAPKGVVFQGSLKFEEAERLFESEMIIKALRKTNYVQTRAAELLGISRRILKYKMDKLGISDQPIAAQAEEVNEV